MRIIVVGAGLSGLSTAISCAQGCHKVVVLEAARELAEIGAGLQITPNGSKLFKEWGILERLRSLAAEPTFLAVRRYSDGKELSRTNDYNTEMWQKYDAPFWDLHRVDLQRILVDRATELGVQVQLGARMTAIDFDTPCVTLESGETISGDLVVAADGLWSRCREQYLASLGQGDSPLPTGDLAYRIVLDAADVEDIELRDWISKPSVNFWIGPGCHAVGYSVRGGSMFNVVLLCPDDLPEGVARQSSSLEEMRALFKDWDPILRRFLDQVTTVDKWKLMHRPELDSWVNDKFNFVFVGDSCHPMLPYLAQGANSSIEDGAVLGMILAELDQKADLPQALRLYQDLRKKRGEAIVREAFAQQQDFHVPDGAEQEARDNLMLSRFGKQIDCKFPSRWQCPFVQPWLYGYSARREVDAALSMLRGE